MSGAWRGRVSIAREWLVYAGPIAPTTVHAHHAFQVVVGDVAVADRAGTVHRAGVALMIEPDVPHAIAEPVAQAAIVFVDPHSRFGRSIPREGPARVARSIPGAEGDACGLLAMARSQPAELVSALAHPFGTSTRVPAPRHRAVSRALSEIERALPARVRAVTIADAAGVSESHLAHLFRDEVGTTLRAYVLWSRLLLAGRSLERGGTIAHAAHAAGFADAAHLTRTFRRMFGIAPSDVAGLADWTVVDDARG